MGWDDPPQWGYVRKDAHEAQVMGGVMRGGIEEGLSRDTYERIRHGYMCLQCKEPHPTPWPEVCSLCGFPIKKQQRRFLQILDRGEAKLGRDYGSSIDWTDEIARLDWELAEDEWREHGGHGIVVPGKGS